MKFIEFTMKTIIALCLISLWLLIISLPIKPTIIRFLRGQFANPGQQQRIADREILCEMARQNLAEIQRLYDRGSYLEAFNSLERSEVLRQNMIPRELQQLDELSLKIHEVCDALSEKARDKRS